jgi:hypothetical protein
MPQTLNINNATYCVRHDAGWATCSGRGHGAVRVDFSVPGVKGLSRRRGCLSARTGVIFAVMMDDESLYPKTILTLLYLTRCRWLWYYGVGRCQHMYVVRLIGKPGVLRAENMYSPV